MDAPWYIGLTPWIVFAIAMRSDGQSLAWGSAAALFTALVALVIVNRSGRRTAVEATAPVLFAGFLLGSALASGEVLTDLTDWARIISALALATVCLATARSHPFPRVHLEQLVPPHQAQTPAFAALCTSLARRAGAVALAIAASHTLAVAAGGAAGRTVFNWIVPLALIAVATGATRGRLLDAFDALDDEEPAGAARDIDILTLELGVPGRHRGTET